MLYRVKRILLFALILFNAGWFFMYGFMKCIGHQMTHADAANYLLKDISPSGIMWYFFGLSFWYPKIIGLSQIITGISIVFKKTRFIGVLFYLFISGNIFFINVFYHISNFLVGFSAVLFINALIILYSERTKLFRALE